MPNVLSVYPADGSILYESAIVPIEVTLILGAGQELPTDCTVTAAVASGSFARLESGSGYDVTVTLPLDKVNAGTAQAVFYLELASGKLGDQLALDIRVTPASLAAAISPGYNIGVKPKISYHDPRPVYLTTAPDDAQTPETFPAVQYSVEVLDNDNAVPGYVVEWRQAWDSALFRNMRAFDAANGAPLPVLPSADADNTFVRTSTDRSGVATLYLVPTVNQVYGGVRVYANMRAPRGLERLVVMDPRVAPSLQEPGILLAQGAGGYDLDTSPGNFVGVTINSSDFSLSDPTQILLFANDELVATLFTIYSEDTPPPAVLPFQVAKIAFHSNTGPGAGELNDFFYIVATRTKGVSTSRHTTFLATGSRGNDQPVTPPGKQVLNAPYVLPDGSYVNLATIANGLNLGVPIRTAGQAWTPAVGDQVFATLYLKGWTPDGKVADKTLPQSRKLTQDDLGDDAYVFNFDHPLVAGFDPSPDIPSRAATFMADYYVLPAGQDPNPNNYIHSRVFSRALDTAAPGSEAWTPAERAALAGRRRLRGRPAPGATDAPASAAPAPVLGLAPPWLPQADPQGGIDLDTAGPTITINIPAYTDLRPNDRITAYIGQEPAQTVTVDPNPYLPTLISVKYPSIGLTPGSYPVWYTAVDYGSNNASTSPSSRVVLTSSSESAGGGWAGVGAIGFNFDGLPQQDIRAVRIYANGRHQAALKISITLLDASGQLLRPPDYPQINDLLNAIQLIDFDSRTPLGTASLGQWAVDTVANEFVKHLPPANSRDIVEGATAADANGNRIDRGVAYLTLYVRSLPAIVGYRLSLGMKITPNSDGDSRPLFNANGGDFSQPAYLQVIDPVAYTTAKLSVQGTHDPHDGESDDGLFNAYGPEIQGNYWRKWDYAVRLTDTASPNGNRIYQCRVKGTLPADWAFSSASNGIYNYKAYFWPRNVFDANGAPIAGSEHDTFVLQAPGSSDEYAQPPAGNDYLALTLFCTFGNIDLGGYSYFPIDLTIFDQFGNSGDFTLDPALNPKQYDVSTLPTLSFLVNGNGQAGPSRSQPSSNGAAHLICAGWSTVLVPLGLNTNAGVASTLNGRNPLQLTLRNETFKFSDTSHQPFNSNRMYTISVSGDCDGETIDYDHDPDNTLLAPIGATHTAATWYLGPVWARNTTAISTPGDGQSWYSWWPTSVNTSNYGSWVAVLIGQYTNDRKFEWKIGPTS